MLQSFRFDKSFADYIIILYYMGEMYNNFFSAPLK